MTIAPAPASFHTVNSYPVEGGPLKVTLTGAATATVRAERRHPNERPPLLRVDNYGHEYLVDAVVCTLETSGEWRAAVGGTFGIRRADGIACTGVARVEILTAIAKLVGDVATPATRWLAERNRLYRESEALRLKLDSDRENVDTQRAYDQVNADIARHLTTA